MPIPKRTHMTSPRIATMNAMFRMRDEASFEILRTRSSGNGQPIVGMIFGGSLVGLCECGVTGRELSLAQ